MDNTEKEKTTERIVMDLFKEAGFKVFRYGFEHLLPELASEKLLQGNVAGFIKQQPDFVVVNKENTAFFVEVKFESNCVLEKDAFNYPDCFVVLLTKEGVLAQNAKYVKHKGWKFDGLNEFHPFGEISKKLLEKYTEIAKKKLGEEIWTELDYFNFVKKKIGKPVRQVSDLTAISQDKPKPTVKFVVREKTEEEKLEIAKGIVKPEKKIRRPDKNRPQNNRWSRSHKRKSFGDKKDYRPVNRSFGKNNSTVKTKTSGDKNNNNYNSNKINSGKINFNRNKINNKNKFSKGNFRPRRPPFQKKRFNTKPQPPLRQATR